MPQIPFLETKAKAEPKQVTLEESQDREPNSRQERGEAGSRREMTEEELDRALEVIKALPGVESSALTAKLVKGEGHASILIIGSQGEIIRRLTTADLWQVLAHQEKKTGQIFDKVL